MACHVWALEDCDRANNVNFTLKRAHFLSTYGAARPDLRTTLLRAPQASEEFLLVIYLFS